MAVVVQQHHMIKAPTPTWFLVNVTPPPAPRGPGRKAVLASYSPLLLSPSAWHQGEQDEKKRNKDDDGEGLPASPRITCMGQVKGRRRRCSSARGPAAPPRDSRYRSAGAGASGKVASLVLGLFGMRRNDARTTSSRACAKVRDVPRAGSASASATGSTRGVRRCSAVAAVGVFDPPLPVVRRPATDGGAPSLWERRCRGGRALEGLQLMTQIAAAAAAC